MSLRSTLCLGAAVAVTLSACTYGFPYDLDKTKRDIAAKGDYWQRTNPADARVQQGPKGQQMLNRDLANCVTELTELMRLGQIKSIIPAEAQDRETATDPALARLRHWDSPERDGALLAENGQYSDVDTCMKSKGWERTMYVPYDTADRAAGSYMASHVDYKKWQQRTLDTSAGHGSTSPGDYDHLNN